MANDTSGTRIGDLAVPDLSTEPGTYWCVHVPQGSHQDICRLEVHFVSVASQRQQTAVVARMARTHKCIRYLFRPETSIEWLMREAGVSGAQAKMMVDSFGIHVRNVLNHNAANPRCLLGLAAALSQSPDVLIYSTTGLDPVGIDTAHRYVEAHRSGRSAIRISHPPASLSLLRGVAQQTPIEPPDRRCPPAAVCVSLTKTRPS